MYLDEAERDLLLSNRGYWCKYQKTGSLLSSYKVLPTLVETLCVSVSHL